MPWSRASELNRAVTCPGSTHLPRVLGKSPEVQAKADWGTIVHRWKETGKWPSIGGRAGMPFRRRAAALIAAGKTREDYWPPEVGEHEVAVALHTKNRIVARFSGAPSEKEAWKASFNHEWLTGTADWLADLGFGTAWVDDLKTGVRTYYDAATGCEVPALPADPWTEWQWRFYAICAVMLLDSKDVLTSLTSWPRYPADGIPERWWGNDRKPVLREEVLDLHLPLLEHARLNALDSKTSLVVVPSQQCKFCPSRASCPLDIDTFLETGSLPKDEEE